MRVRVTSVVDYEITDEVTEAALKHAIEHREWERAGVIFDNAAHMQRVKELEGRRRFEEIGGLHGH